MSEKILKNIHCLDPWFKKRFKKLTYYLAVFVVILFFISPYSVRIVWAFLLNFIFNNPITYINLFSQKIGKNISVLVMMIFYLSIFGVYAISYKFLRLFKTSDYKVSSTWVQLSQQVTDNKHYYHPF